MKLTNHYQVTVQEIMDYSPIITAIVGAGVITVAVLTYLFHQRQHKLNGLLEAFKLLNDEKHREARRILYSIYDIYKEKHDVSIFTSSSLNRDAVEIVRADFDQTGILVKRGSILKDAFLDAYGFSAYQCWEILKDHIADERSSSKRGFDEYMRNFQTIALDAYNYWWKKEGVILKGP